MSEPIWSESKTLILSDLSILFLNHLSKYIGLWNRYGSLMPQSVCESYSFFGLVSLRFFCNMNSSCLREKPWLTSLFTITFSGLRGFRSWHVVEQLMRCEPVWWHHWVRAEHCCSPCESGVERSGEFRFVDCCCPWSFLGADWLVRARDDRCLLWWWW